MAEQGEIYSPEGKFLISNFRTVIVPEITNVPTSGHHTCHCIYFNLEEGGHCILHSHARLFSVYANFSDLTSVFGYLTLPFKNVQVISCMFSHDRRQRVEV